MLLNWLIGVAANLCIVLLLGDAVMPINPRTWARIAQSLPWPSDGLKINVPGNRW